MTLTDTASRSALARCPFCGTLNRVNLARLSDGPKCGGCHRPLLLDRPIKATDQDFEKIIRGTEVPVLVDFHADWCGPCRMMAPILDEFAHSRAGKLLVLKLDTDHNPATGERFGIRGIPTLIAFRGGREIGRHVGLAQVKILEALVAGGSGSTV